MAARKIKHLSNEWRQKIQTSMLINRLQSFINGEVELTSTQVNAISILLKKSLPDLQAIELSGDEDNPIVHSHNLASKILEKIPTEELEKITSEAGIENNG